MSLDAMDQLMADAQDDVLKASNIIGGSPSLHEVYDRVVGDVVYRSGEALSRALEDLCTAALMMLPATATDEQRAERADLMRPAIALLVEAKGCGIDCEMMNRGLLVMHSTMRVLARQVIEGASR